MKTEEIQNFIDEMSLVNIWLSSCEMNREGDVDGILSIPVTMKTRWELGGSELRGGCWHTEVKSITEVSVKDKKIKDSFKVKLV